MGIDNPILTEKELEQLFAGGKKKKKSHFLSHLYTVATAIFIFCLIYVGLNFGSLKEKLIFWYENDYQTTTPAPNISTVSPNSLKTTTKEEKPDMAVIPDNSLAISTINIQAPITWDIPNTTKDTAAGLQNGLIHLSGTAHPGEVGNVFITGHSSNYPWAKGNYNNIFALLDKLVVGDKIQVKYQNVDYLYTVKEIKVVQPTDISVLKQGTDSILTLSTCTPVGTSLRRLIIISDQTYPDPQKNKSTNSNSVNATTIPSAQ